jgi:hypothetical protein
VIQYYRKCTQVAENVSEDRLPLAGCGLRTPGVTSESYSFTGAYSPGWTFGLLFGVS